MAIVEQWCWAIISSYLSIELFPKDVKYIRFFLFFFTLQSLQQGPVAHSDSVVNLQVIGSQQGSSSLHSLIVPQSHCSPSSITLFPHLLISNWILKTNRNNYECKLDAVLRAFFYSIHYYSINTSFVLLGLTSFGLLKRQPPWPDFKASI